MEENSSVETVVPCCVFWDVVDFPFPAGLSPDSIYKKMKSCLEMMGYCVGEIKIKAYVSKEKLSDGLAGEWRDAGIAIQGAESESARVHSLLVDIVLWAFENPASYWEPLNLMVISKNIKDGTYYLDALEALKYRYYNVLLALPHDLSSKELHTVPVSWVLGCLTDDGGRQKSICQSPPTLQLHKPKIKDQLDTIFEVLPFKCNLGSVPVFFDVDSFPSCDDVEPKFDLVKILWEVFSLKGVSAAPLVWSYVDEGEKIEEKYRGYEWHGWQTVVVPTGDKYAKVTRMLLDILFSAMNNNVPKIMMLLSHASTDTKCFTVIGALEARGFKFILAPSNENLPMKLSADYFELNCKKIIHTTRNYSPSSTDVVLLLDGKDWEDINPECLFDSMKDPLERKGYCLQAISVYLSSSKSKNMEYYDMGEFGVRSVSSSAEWMLPLMLADIALMSQRFLYGRPTFIIMSNPSKSTIPGKQLVSILHQLNRKGISVLFAFPDVLWLTFGCPLWSAKSFYARG